MPSPVENRKDMPPAYRAQLGPYWLLLPESAILAADVVRSPPGAYRMAFTTWVISLGRFTLRIHLEADRGPQYLKTLVDGLTRGDVTTSEFSINGIRGFKYGGYGPPDTWIDWWVKKGDLTICLTLQSISHTVGEPTRRELEEHERIILSLKYAPDWPSELPPV